jgi:hypothetical protein
MMKNGCLVAVAAISCAQILGVPSGFAQQSVSHRSVLLVLDASGSMAQRMPDGSTRLDAAKFAAADVLSKLPLGTRVGLRVYGNQANAADKNCDDTSLVAPLDSVERNREPLGAAFAAVRTRGYTPISLSLERAASDLSAEAGSERVVILLSDGRETCKGDPCGVAHALAAADAKLVVHSIGLGVDAAARTQLQCIASAARGTYYDANTSSELIERLGQAVVAKALPLPEQPPGAAVGYLQVKGIVEAGVPVLDTKGEIVGPVGALQHKLDLPPGIYSVQFVNGLWTGIEIKAGETTEIEPAYLQIETPAKDNLYLLDGETSEEVGSFFMQADAVVAVLPGRYSARTSLPFGWTDVDLVAGKTTVLKPALARIVHTRNASDFTSYRITQVSSRTQADVVNGSDMSLPPGRYRIEDPTRAGSAVEVELAAGEVREVAFDR